MAFVIAAQAEEDETKGVVMLIPSDSQFVQEAAGREGLNLAQSPRVLLRRDCGLRRVDTRVGREKETAGGLTEFSYGNSGL